MSLAPLLAAPLAIQFHTAFAAAALLFSAAVFLSAKGTPHHILAGRVAAVSLLGTALSSFAIRTGGTWSWIHLLSLLTLASLGMGFFAIRAGRRRAHARAMTGAAIGLMIAGLFTLLPGRIMHQMLFGP